MKDDDKVLESQRSRVWRPVWSDRDADRADWNGFEDCFDSIDAYVAWVADVGALLIKRLDLGPADVVGDLGCGTGRVAAHIATHVRAVRALDYSDTVIRVASQRRARDNVQYGYADLNSFDPEGLDLTKAFSFGALLYLDNEERVFDLIRRLHANQIDFAALDLPDDQLVDVRPRAYDRRAYSHLQFNEHRLLEEFPDGLIARGEFPGYVNGITRFNFYLFASRVVDNDNR